VLSLIQPEGIKGANKVGILGDRKRTSRRARRTLCPTTKLSQTNPSLAVLFEELLEKKQDGTVDHLAERLVTQFMWHVLREGEDLVSRIDDAKFPASVMANRFDPLGSYDVVFARNYPRVTQPPRPRRLRRGRVLAE